MRTDKTWLWLWSFALVAYVVAHPDNYKYQDFISNKSINLLDILKDYDQNERERQQAQEQDQEQEFEPEEEHLDDDHLESAEESLDNWTGPWMPHRPDEPTRPPKILPPPEKHIEHTTVINQLNKTIPHERSHYGGRIPMGVKSSKCDDGRTNLTTDWDYNLSALTCYGSKIKPNLKLPASSNCKPIPKDYVAAHQCMYNVIEYNDDIPLFGTHRPIWPVYGEYFYLPKQRWLHSLEHGAIVMLYHPCANKIEVDKLKKLVKKCLRRHIITPYNMLDEDRPLALLAWGCILSMSHVNKDAVVDFITHKALDAPEEYIHQDGGFSDQLIEKAAIVSDLKDSTLCPKLV